MVGRSKEESLKSGGEQTDSFLKSLEISLKDDSVIEILRSYCKNRNEEVFSEDFSVDDYQITSVQSENTEIDKKIQIKNENNLPIHSNQLEIEKENFEAHENATNELKNSKKLKNNLNGEVNEENCKLQNVKKEKHLNKAVDLSKNVFMTDNHHLIENSQTHDFSLNKNTQHKCTFNFWKRRLQRSERNESINNHPKRTFSTLNSHKKEFHGNKQSFIDFSDCNHSFFNEKSQLVKNLRSDSKNLLNNKKIDCKFSDEENHFPRNSTDRKVNISQFCNEIPLYNEDNLKLRNNNDQVFEFHENKPILMSKNSENIQLNSKNHEKFLKSINNEDIITKIGSFYDDFSKNNTNESIQHKLDIKDKKEHLKTTSIPADYINNVSLKKSFIQNETIQHKLDIKGEKEHTKTTSIPLDYINKVSPKKSFVENETIEHKLDIKGEKEHTKTTSIPLDYSNNVASFHSFIENGHKKHELDIKGEKEHARKTFSPNNLVNTCNSVETAIPSISVKHKFDIKNDKEQPAKFLTSFKQNSALKYKYPPLKNGLLESKSVKNEKLENYEIFNENSELKTENHGSKLDLRTNYLEMWSNHENDLKNNINLQDGTIFQLDRNRNLKKSDFYESNPNDEFLSGQFSFENTEKQPLPSNLNVFYEKFSKKQSFNLKNLNTKPCNKKNTLNSFKNTIDQVHEKEKIPSETLKSFILCNENKDKSITRLFCEKTPSEELKSFILSNENKENSINKSLCEKTTSEVLNSDKSENYLLKKSQNYNKSLSFDDVRINNQNSAGLENLEENREDIITFLHSSQYNIPNNKNFKYLNKFSNNSQETLKNNVLNFENGNVKNLHPENLQNTGKNTNICLNNKISQKKSRNSNEKIIFDKLNNKFNEKSFQMKQNKLNPFLIDHTNKNMSITNANIINFPEEYKFSSRLSAINSHLIENISKNNIFSKIKNQISTNSISPVKKESILSSFREKSEDNYEILKNNLTENNNQNYIPKMLQESINHESKDNIHITDVWKALSNPQKYKSNIKDDFNIKSTNKKEKEPFIELGTQNLRNIQTINDIKYFHEISRSHKDSPLKASIDATLGKLSTNIIDYKNYNCEKNPKSIFNKSFLNKSGENQKNQLKVFDTENLIESKDYSKKSAIIGGTFIPQNHIIDYCNHYKEEKINFKDPDYKEKEKKCEIDANKIHQIYKKYEGNQIDENVEQQKLKSNFELPFYITNKKSEIYNKKRKSEYVISKNQKDLEAQKQDSKNIYENDSIKHVNKENYINISRNNTNFESEVKFNLLNSLNNYKITKNEDFFAQDVINNNQKQEDINSLVYQLILSQNKIKILEKTMNQEKSELTKINNNLRLKNNKLEYEIKCKNILLSENREQLDFIKTKQIYGAKESLDLLSYQNNDLENKITQLNSFIENETKKFHKAIKIYENTIHTQSKEIEFLQKTLDESKNSQNKK